jgi:hypothetical protein
MLNNITGISPSTNKLNDVIEWIKSTMCDTLGFQEAIIFFTHQKSRTHTRRHIMNKSRITASEIKWIYEIQTEAEGTFSYQTTNGDKNSFKITGTK